jgi:DNA-binding SARP family transcriptional activator
LASLELALLGGFQAKTPSQGTIRIVGKKNRALLAYLALGAGRQHARDKLVGLLWSDRGNDQGRSSLRQSLIALRKDLSGIVPHPVATDGEYLTVPPASIEVDALDFERLARSERIEDLEQAAVLYRGDLLDGLPVQDAAFVEWLSTERNRLRDLASEVMTRLIPLRVGIEAVAMARRLVAIDPLRETAHRTLIGLLADLGQTEAALRHYHIYAEMLEQQLGIRPSAAAQALYGEIGGQARGAAVPEALPERDARTADKPVVAVLPFESRSADPQHQHFCDLLGDDVSDALSRVSSFLVIARAATAAYLGKAVDVRQIGADLGAAYVLQGSVHRLGDRLRISTQLSDTASGLHLWAEQFDYAAAELLDLEDLIVRTMAGSIETQIVVAGRNRLRDAASGPVTAQDLILRGTGLLYNETAESYAESKRLAEQAIALEPRNPMAHLLRAEAHVYCLATRLVEYDAEKAACGVDLATAALAMAPGYEWAHLACAQAYVDVGKIEVAITHCERALEISPSNANAFARLGQCHALLGRSTEAIGDCRHALEFNPRGTENFAWHFSLALAHFVAENHADALQEALRVRRLRPDFLRADVLVAASATALGRKAEADAALAQCLARYPDLRTEDIAPRIMPGFARSTDRERLAALLVAAGLPGAG